MSPLFLITLTAAAKIVREGHQVDRELDMAGDVDMDVDIAGVDADMEVDMIGIVTQDVQNKNSGSENLFGNVATKKNMQPRFQRFYRSGRFLI